VIRRHGLTSLILLALVGLVPTAWARVQGTTATVYRPFSASGASKLSGPTNSGHCWTSSETTGRYDAWRCISGNYIYDPCFASSLAKGFVLCPLAPWRNSGVKLRLTRPLPTALANHGGLSASNQPWALELYDGRTACWRVAPAPWSTDAD
jgi:hypothetical protein